MQNLRIENCISEKCKLKLQWGDFPGGPVVKTLPSSAGGSGLIPGPGANSIKTFKITHIKKKKSLRKTPPQWGITTHPPLRLKWKRQTLSNVSKGTEPVLIFLSCCWESKVIQPLWNEGMAVSHEAKHIPTTQQFWF